MKKEEQLLAEAEEFGLANALEFLGANRTRIALFGVAGLLIAITFVLRMSEVYEATFQMQMAQFVSRSSSSSYSSSNSSASSTSNIEDPDALIQRFRFSRTYPVEVLRQCGVPESSEFGEYLDKRLEIKTIKNVPTVVDVKVRAPSADQARQCADSIVGLIVAQQKDMLKERLSGYKEQLDQYVQALSDEQQQLEESRRSGLGGVGYLARMDKISWLRSRAAGLQEEIALSQARPAKLTVPVNVPSKPIPRKTLLWATIGTLFGLSFGILYSLVCGARRKAQ